MSLLLHKNFTWSDFGRPPCRYAPGALVLYLHTLNPLSTVPIGISLPQNLSLISHSISLKVTLNNDAYAKKFHSQLEIAAPGVAQCKVSAMRVVADAVLRHIG